MRTALVFLLFCAGSLQASLLSSYQAWTNAHPGALLASFFGDSTTAGYPNYDPGYPSWTPTGSQSANIAELVQIGAGGGIGFTNRGVSGARAVFCESLASTVLADKPKYTILRVGINDLADGKTWADVVGNYDAILAKCVASNSIFIVSEVWPSTAASASAISNYNASMRLWAGSNSLSVIPSHDWIADPANQANILATYAADGIHASTAGDARQAELDLGWLRHLSGDPHTFNAADVSFVAVDTARAVATNRDTVLVPVGTGNWTNTLNISTAIKLIGAGIGSTIINSYVPDGNHGIIITGTANETNWLQGFEFHKGRTNYNATAYIKTDFIDTDARRLVVVSNKFLHMPQSIGLFYTTLGVFARNIFIFDTNGIPAALGYAKGSSWGGTQGVNSYGDGSQFEADNFGTDKFLFFEDNVFTNAYPGNLTLFDCQAGGRFVIRHNPTLHGLSLESHGLEAQRERSGRAFEVYCNSFTGYGDRNTLGYFRGGTGIYFSNTISGWTTTACIALLNNRMKDSLAEPFGGADGRNPWDSNSVSNPFITGTASSAGSLTVTDSGKSWTVNQWVGYTVRRTSGKAVSSLTRSSSTITVNCTGHGFTNGQLVSIFGADQQAYNGIYSITTSGANQFTASIGFTPSTPATGTILACSGNHFSEILGNSASQLTFANSVYGGGYTLVFSPGDTYEINLVVEAMDKPGRVMGVNLAGADTPTQQFLATGQTTSPWYAWNNPREGGGELIFEAISGTIVEGTHFNNNTVKPGYTSYTYPHPLVSGAAPAIPRVLNVLRMRAGQVTTPN